MLVYNDLLFLHEKIKVEKVQKNCDIDDRNSYVANIINLKEVLNHRLKLKKVHRVIKFKKKLD